MLETALRWCVWHSKLNVGGVEYKDGRKGNDGIIVGVSSYKQLEGNLADCEKGPLPEEVVKCLDEAWMIAKGMLFCLMVCIVCDDEANEVYS